MYVHRKHTTCLSLLFKINGKHIPGPIIDFAVLMFHNAENLASAESGPFFYLSKLENSSEAKLWNKIFTWSQERLNVPYGTIKACVLIENILASFETEEILYELRDHSLGLNCGIWDYAASIVSVFGNYRFDRKACYLCKFVLPQIFILTSVINKTMSLFPLRGGNQI